MKELGDPGALFQTVMEIAVRLAAHGLIHCDLNEFNLMLGDDGKITLIDFPQMVSTEHPNAEMYFDRDIACIRTFCERRFGFVSTAYPRFADVVREASLDVDVAASGFSRDLQTELERVSTAGGKGSENGSGEFPLPLPLFFCSPRFLANWIPFAHLLQFQADEKQQGSSVRAQSEGENDSSSDEDEDGHSNEHDGDGEASPELDRATSTSAEAALRFVSCNSVPRRNSHSPEDEMRAAEASQSCATESDTAAAAVPASPSSDEAGEVSDLDTLTGRDDEGEDEADDLENVGAHNRAARAFRDPVRHELPAKETRMPLTRTSIQDKVKQSMAKKKHKPLRVARNKSKGNRGQRESCTDGGGW